VTGLHDAADAIVDVIERERAFMNARVPGQPLPPPPPFDVDDGGDGDGRPAMHRPIPNAADLEAEAPPENDNEHLESWQRVDLGPVLRGEIRPVVPSILRRDDCVACFYAGRVNGLHGDSAVGKSWVAEIAAAQELKAGHHVIWIDLEDPDATTLIERLRLLGVSDESIDERLHYYRPDVAFSRDAVDLIVDEARAHAVTLIVIDSIGEAFGLAGLNEDKDGETGPWYRRVARPLADTGAAVIVIDHSTKANDNPLHPSGSKRKRAAITGASYLVEAPKSLTREDGGRLRLTCAKDRHGHHRQRSITAEIEFTVDPDGGTTVHVSAPGAETNNTDGNWEPTGLMEGVSRALEAGPLSKAKIREKVRGKVAYIDIAIERLVERGHVGTTEPRPGVATIHTILDPYRQPTDNPDPTPTQPRPGRGDNPDPSTHPLRGGRGQGHSHPVDPDPDRDDEDEPQEPPEDTDEDGSEPLAGDVDAGDQDAVCVEEVPDPDDLAELTGPELEARAEAILAALRGEEVGNE
jgi:hypothetical protein